jgi:hypothetical protein
MRFLVFLAIFIFSLALQWFLGRWISVWGFGPPLALVSILVALWRLPFLGRLWFALGSGIILDVVYPVPFGTESVLLVGTSIIFEILRNKFSNLNSKFVEGLSLGIVLWLIISATLPLGSLLSIAEKTHYYFRLSEWGSAIFAALFWASLVFVGYFMFHLWFRNKKDSLFLWRA